MRLHIIIVAILLPTLICAQELLQVSSPLPCTAPLPRDASNYEYMHAYFGARLEPEDGRVYHGVGQSNTGVQEYIDAMADSTIMPIVVNFYYDIPGTRGNKFEELRSRLAMEKAIGRIPHLSIAMTDGRVWTDSIIATSRRYDDIIDTLATIVRDYGGRIFVRPGFEFGGTWFPYHAYLYPKAFRKIVDRFRAVAEPDSMAFLWCYYPAAPNDFDSTNGRGEYKWYPGDDHVDWFSLDLFKAGDFHPDSADSRRGVLTPKGKSERFLAMARDHAKPVFLSELSATYINVTTDPSDGMNDWNAWFVPFFRFLSGHPEIKGFNYTNWNWSDYTQWAEWGDSRIEINPFILARYREELRNPRYIHLRTAASGVNPEAIQLPREMNLSSLQQVGSRPTPASMLQMTPCHPNALP